MWTIEALIPGVSASVLLLVAGYLLWLLIETRLKSEVSHQYSLRFSEHTKKLEAANESASITLRANLEATNAAQLEILKKEVLLEIFRKQTALGRLLIKRAEAIEKLYPQFEELYKSALYYTQLLELPNDLPRPERGKQTWDQLVKLEEVFAQNRLYLTEETDEKCARIMDKMRFDLIRFNIEVESITNQQGRDSSTWIEVFGGMKSDLQDVVGDLRASFRDALNSTE